MCKSQILREIRSSLEKCFNKKLLSLMFCIVISCWIIMHSNYSSKSARISSRSTKKQQQSKSKKQKLSNGKIQSAIDQEESHNQDIFKETKQQEFDQWIFNDQKLKVQQHSFPQDYQIRSRISIHRKNKSLKLHFIENQIRNKTPQLKIEPPIKAKICNKVPRKISKQEINNKFDKDEQKTNDMSKLLTQRYNLPLGLKQRRHANTSLQTYPNLNHFLKAKAFSIQLTKHRDFQEKIYSPLREKMYKTITLSPKVKKGLNEAQKYKYMQKQSSFAVKNQNLRKIQINTPLQRHKFHLNGWEVQSPSFHDIEEIYRQRNRQLQTMPLSKQGQTLAKRAANISVK